VPDLGFYVTNLPTWVPDIQTDAESQDGGAGSGIQLNVTPDLILQSCNHPGPFVEPELVVVGLETQSLDLGLGLVNLQVSTTSLL